MKTKTKRNRTRLSHVLAVLKENADCYERSYRERDGVVRDKMAVRHIAGLREAIRIVKGSR